MTTPTLTRFGIIYTDATEERSYRIQPRDANPAKQADPECCAIARAVKRIEQVPEVHIHNRVALVVLRKPVGYREGMKPGQYKPGVGVRYFLDPYTEELRKKFDRDGLFPRGEVRLIPPPETGRLGYRRGTKPGSNKRTRGGGLTVYRRAAEPKAEPTRQRPRH